ncbi:hypothetical protein AVANS14531_07075 [Campylobacter sp. Cr9]|uniref:hypothetical protein n=1 Tax=Campylobacter sp. Cr9 TaxID=2735728 RepID=UPI003014C75E|nr:hypothetical protein [Campylobacter sp. Cr9]
MFDILNELKPFLPDKEKQAEILANLKAKKEAKPKLLKHKNIECIFLSLDARKKSKKCIYKYEDIEFNCESEIGFLKKLYPDIKVNIFCTEKTQKTHKYHMGQKLIKITNDEKLFSQISNHLKLKTQYIFIINNLKNHHLAKALNLVKYYNIELLDFLKLKNKVQVSKIQNEFDESYSNVLFALNEFENTLKMPFLDTKEPLFLAFKDFSKFLLLGNYERFISAYKTIITITTSISKTSIFKPFKEHILNIFKRFGFDKLNITKSKANSYHFVDFKNFLIVAKLFYDKSYYLNSAIMLKEGINLSIYKYFLDDFGGKFSNNDKQIVFWYVFSEIERYNELSIDVIKHIKLLNQARAKVSDVRNAFVHLECGMDYELLIKELKICLDTTELVFLKSALSNLKQHKHFLISKVKEILQNRQNGYENTNKLKL